MQLFSEWSERQSQITRWILVVGWLLLIVSLLFGLNPYPFDVNRCAGSSECHAHAGNQIFWGMVVPAGLFTLVVLSHEVWRRICPLAFVSQLFRALGWQRTVVGKGGRREVAKVEAGSWLGRHHVQLQWTLLIAGEKPVEALIFSRSRFEQLLQQSSEFSRSLLRQMAWRIEALYARAGSAIEAA